MPSRPVGDLSIDCLSNRFCYWQSEAGDRYLFSQIATDDIANFSNCVLLIAVEKDAMPQVHWVGEIANLSPLSFKGLNPDDMAHMTIYVHLLAGGKTERNKVVADLSSEADKSACRLIA